MPTITPARVRGRRARRAAVAGVLAACVLPATASAATVGIAADGTLAYRGSDGEANSLSVRQLAEAIEVTDSSAGVKPTQLFNSFAQLCVPVGSTKVRCGHRPVRIKRIAADLNDRNDVASAINTHLPVAIGGGSGTDSFFAGASSFLTNVTFRGGSGDDTADYGLAGQGVNGVSVRLSNDGIAGDGRPGLDQDNIDKDVENLTGSPFADELTTGTNGGSLRGGQGADTLRAGTGPTAFEMGRVADGADRIINSTGFSTVDYGERTKPVTATIDFGGADDGEPGEGDEIDGRHDAAEGGAADDRLHAPRGSLAPYLFKGNGGNDTIDGATGNDTVFGGSGGDTITTRGGNDRIVIGALDFDAVDCGSGVDTVELAGGGLIHVSCENRIGPAAG